MDVLQKDTVGLLVRAGHLRQAPHKASASQTLAQLIGVDAVQQEPESMRVGSRVIGNWQRGNRGRAIITLDQNLADDAALPEIAEAIAGVLNRRAAKVDASAPA